MRQREKIAFVGVEIEMKWNVSKVSKAARISAQLLLLLPLRCERDQRQTETQTETETETGSLLRA